MNHSTAVATVLVSVLLLAACGSSGSSGISKADYLTKANAICKAGDAKLNAEAKVVTSQATLAPFLKQTAVPQIRSDIAEIEKLGYPKGDQATLQKLFTATDQVLDEVAANPTDYDQPNVDPFAAENKGLDDYGLTACGSNA